MPKWGFCGTKRLSPLFISNKYVFRAIKSSLKNAKLKNLPWEIFCAKNDIPHFSVHMFVPHKVEHVKAVAAIHNNFLNKSILCVFCFPMMAI